MTHKLLIFSTFFIIQSLFCPSIEHKNSAEEEQIVYHYQFDENQKRLIVLAEEPKETQDDNEEKKHPTRLPQKTKCETYYINLEKELTSEMVDDWVKKNSNNQSVIIFCFQTKSIDQRIDEVMKTIELKIIPLFIQRGFSPDCMIKTIELKPHGTYASHDRIQITIFFSDNTLDSILDSVVDLDMKL